MNKSYFIFLFVALGVLCSGIVFAGARFATYVDVPSMMIVILITASLLVSSFRLKEIGSFFAGAFRERTADIPTLKKGICFFTAMQRYLIISAVIGTMIGVIAMLSILGEPRAIGSGLGLALLTILYAVVLILVVAVPFRTSLARKLAEAEKVTVAM